METEAVITLQEVTRKNLAEILNLKVTSEQENFISSNAVSIAEAHFCQEFALFRAIYAGEIPVGFVLLDDDSANSFYAIWRFMIDEHFQRHGFGKQALELVVEYIKTRPGAKVLLVSVPGEGSPETFYKKMGFTSTGETDEDGELILKYEL